MPMIRAVIIEDESKSLRVIQNLIAKYFSDSIRELGHTDSVEHGIRLIEDTNPDLVFLDIELTDGSSFSILKHFPHPKFSVIFTTAFDNYAIKAFKFSAIDYLLKPIDDEEFQDAVRRYVQLRSMGNNQSEHIHNADAIYHAPQDIYQNKLAIRSLHQVQFVWIRDIIALQADKNYTVIITTGDKYTSSKNLGHYEELLESTSHFLRIHHSTIINIHYIEELFHAKAGAAIEVLMINGTHYMTSVRKASELRKIMGV